MVRETVLEAYQRLEAEAVWRAGAEAQGRNVVVSIGQATLTVSDLNDVALAHWSLASLTRLNPGRTPAVFSPGADAPETLETDEAEMVDALERVMGAVRKGGQRRGRLRVLVTLGTVAALTALVTFWLPGALARYAAGIVPEATRAALGARMVGHVETLTGAPCASQTGTMALGKLQTRLFPNGKTRLSIAPSALSGAIALPGGYDLVSHKLVEDYETPAVAAAYAVEQDELRDESDPMVRLLADAGLSSIIRLLTTGEVPESALRKHAEALVGAPLQSVDIAKVAPRVAQAGLSVAALADALQGEAPSGLAAAAAPALNDGEWIALQSICTQ